MKKILTILFCTVAFSSAFAQTNRHDDRNKNADPNWNSSASQRSFENNRQRDFQIQRITQQYDFKIQQVSNDRFLNRRQKRRAIESLQAQKASEINNIYSQYNVYNNKSYNKNNGYYDNDRRK